MKPLSCIRNKWSPATRRTNLTALKLAVQCGSNRPQDCAPLLEAIENRAARDEAAFHVPGHKRGKGVSKRFQQLAGTALRCDLTEVAGLDYLSSPKGVIADAQKLASELLGADRTWFLVNGCSVGIHAAVMATCGPGQTLLVARNCHLSVFSAMVLSGCTPGWIHPEYDQYYGIAHCIMPAALEQALQQARQEGQDVGAVMLVSPTYFGSVARVKELACICHAYDVPLLVDEAHGAHFSLNPDVPASALHCGADLVIQSTHKTLSSMTQSAMLHVKGQKVQVQRISRALQTLQTSSPSYVLMASLDAARQAAAQPGFLAAPLEAAAAARAGLQSVPGLQLLGCSSAEAPESTCAFDPLRIVVLTRDGLGLSGFDAAALLEEDHGVVPELATSQLVVLAMGPGSDMRDAQRLVRAFKTISANMQHASSDDSCTRKGSTGSFAGGASTEGLGRATGFPEPRFSPRDAFFRETEIVDTSAAVGRASAELLCPYPPGVPVLFPGEVISAEVLSELLHTLKDGGVVTGASDSSLRTLVVLR